MQSAEHGKTRTRPSSAPRKPRDYSGMHRQLIAMRRRLLGDFVTLDQRREPSPSAAYNMLNGAQDHERSDEILGALEHTSTTLEQVTIAIARIQDGTYGKCAACTHVIPLTRLEAMPTATMCVRCAAERESGSDRTDRRQDQAFARLALLEEEDTDESKE